MRVRWSECITTDPDVPPEYAWVDRVGEVVGVTRSLFGAKYVVVCADGISREVSIKFTKKEASDVK